MAQHASHHRPKPGPNRLQGLLWAIFANTAVLTALIVPAHILVQGVLAPLGLVPAFDRHADTLTNALADPLVKIYLLVVFAVAFYTFGHRTLYMLLDLGVGGGKRVLGPITYGLAGIGIVAAAVILFS